MQQSYSKNYLRIYFWQALSIILGFVSLLIVTPFLSKDQCTYGIYSVCISVTVFLSYADIGFLSAGQKYAAEAFIRNEREHEIALIGFSHFIFLVFTLLLAALFLILSFNPAWLIKDIKEGYETIVAHDLLLILAFFAPVVVLQRMLQMIFGIRLQEYKFQRIIIIGNLLKICSVFFFFAEGSSNVVTYFLFVQCINLIVAISGLIMAHRLFNYNFVSLLKGIKFEYSIFRQTKSLAFSSLLITVAWVLYYELDSLVIGKVLGVVDVALYTVGFTILTFFRSIFGVLFSPFSARFNHFVGQGQVEQLKLFYQQIVILTFPLVVFPVIAVCVMARSIVITWVGIEYSASIVIVQWLVLCNLFAFISYPAGMLLIAMQNIKTIYKVNILMPIVYWIGIGITFTLWRVESFAIFKFIVFIISGIIYLNISIRFLEINYMVFFKKCVMPYIPGISLMILFLLIFQNYWVEEKNKVYLIYNGVIIVFGIILGLITSYFFTNTLREYIVKLLNSLKLPILK